MKRIFLLSLLLLASVSVKAQEKKLRFSAYTTFDYSHIPETKQLNHYGKFAFGFGLQGNYALTERLDVVLGLAYIDKGYREKYEGFGPTDGRELYDTKWWHAYISIPVKLQYNFGKDTYRWYVAGGVENDFHFDANGGYRYKDVAHSVVVNLGISMAVGAKYRLGLEPTFRNALSSYSTSEVRHRNLPDLKPYSYGLKLILTKVK